MRQNILQIASRVVIITMISQVIFANSSNAQRPRLKLSPIGLPVMFVPKATSMERALWFRFGKLDNNTGGSKFQVLKNIIGLNAFRSIYYSKATLTALFAQIDADAKAKGQIVAGLMVYITSFDRSNPGTIPISYDDKQIILVFAPTSNSTSQHAADFGRYYIINPVTLKVESISAELKNSWSNYYVKEVDQAPGGLSSTLESGNPSENQMPDQTQSDTKSLLYDYTALENFFTTEIPYQQQQNGKMITGIEIDFASISEQGIDGTAYGFTNNKHAFKNRLILQFELAMTDASTGQPAIVYIDDQPDFYERSGLQASQKILAFERSGNVLMYLDNGWICPPNCP